VASLLKDHFPQAPILLLNIFTAIASNITPKNFRIANKPAGPNRCSINFNDFKTMYTTIEARNPTYSGLSI